MKTICIIPARGGSKGLKNKNIRALAGQPLISWPIKAAIQSGVIDKIFVSTDSVEISHCATKAGAEVPFLRDSEYSQDLSTTEAALQHALLRYEEYLGYEFDICVFLTATDVFRSPDWIKEAVNCLKENEALESAFSGHKTTKNYWAKQPSGEWVRLLPWMREYSNRQVRSAIYREDTGLACASRSWLWRSGRRIGDNNHIIVNDDFETCIDIHTEFDLHMAEAAIKYFRNIKSKKYKFLTEHED
jgi:CMP-N,N'-diacetyllegionaminic acid synthase